MAPLDWLFYRQGFTGRTVAKKTVLPDIFLAPPKHVSYSHNLGLQLLPESFRVLLFSTKLVILLFESHSVTKFKYGRKKK